MLNQDVRWIQRFSNYRKALARLTDAIALTEERNLTSHSYDEETADDIADKIVNKYHGLFIQLETRLQVEKINQEKNG